jgi:hypothetical protein
MFPLLTSGVIFATPPWNVTVSVATTVLTFVVADVLEISIVETPPRPAEYTANTAIPFESVVEVTEDAAGAARSVVPAPVPTRSPGPVITAVRDFEAISAGVNCVSFKVTWIKATGVDVPSVAAAVFEAATVASAVRTAARAFEAAVASVAESTDALSVMYEVEAAGLIVPAAIGAAVTVIVNLLVAVAACTPAVNANALTTIVPTAGVGTVNAVVPLFD